MFDRYALLAALVFSVLAVLLMFYGVVSCQPSVSDHIVLDRNTVLVITHDEANLAPLYAFMDEHNISYYIYNVDHPPYYMVYGDRNVPLMPPVVFVPAVVCWDGNRIVGTAGYDLNAAERLVSRCRGLEVNG